MQKNIKHVQIWTGWLRLAHWLIAAAVIFQIISSWALKQPAADHAFWHDWHLMMGQTLILALLLRMILLFLPGSSNWRALLPTNADYSGIQQMIRFYTSFARYPLPNWYAHNPLWKPIYFLFFVLLTICLLAGVFYNSPYLVAGLSIESIHTTSATIITIFVTGHILAVFLHDLKGRGALISAIISGYRYFHIDPVTSDHAGDKDKKVQTYIPVDQIIRKSGEINKSDTDDHSE